MFAISDMEVGVFCQLTDPAIWLNIQIEVLATA
jgi:hypothetical protein